MNSSEFHILYPLIYANRYFWLMLLVCIATAVRFMTISNTDMLRRDDKFPTWAWLLALAYAVYWGMRPEWGFGDTIGYYRHYSLHRFYDTGTNIYALDKEFMWRLLWDICKALGFSARAWLMTVNMLQIGVVAYGLWRLFKGHLWLPLLFTMVSWGFFSFSTNVLRAGVATSFFILAVSYLDGTRKGFLRCLFFLVITFGFHKSTLIPITGLAVAGLFIRSYSVSLAIWVVCLGLSAVLGRFADDFLVDWIDDDKLTVYMTARNYEKDFSVSGFRWDFMLYGMYPLVYAWFMVYHCGLKTSRWYMLLLNTYTLTNAFWLIINRVKFSDRFAALSWFLIALVVTWPLFHRQVSRRQGLLAACMLLFAVSFTFYMSVIR